MSALLHLLWILTPPLLLGTAVLAACGIRRRADPLAWLGWAWMAGALATGAVMLAWSLLRLSWSPAGLTLALVAPALALHALARRRGAPDALAAPPRPAARGWERALFALVLAALLASALDRCVLAWGEPVWSGDASQIWAAKAKLLWLSGGFAPDFGARVTRSLAVSHPEYPPLNPLLQLWTYVLAGGVDLFWSRVPIQAAGLGALLVLAAALRRRARPAIAAPLLLLVASVAGAPDLDLLPSAMSDGLCSLALLVALDAWMRFEEEGGPWLRLFALALAFGASSKNEGLMFAALALAAAGARLLARPDLLGEERPALRARTRRAARALSLPLALALVPAVATALIDARHGFRGDLTSSANAAGRPPWELLPEQLGRAPVVARFVLHAVLLDTDATRLLFLLALVLLALGPRRACAGPQAVPTAVLLGAGLAFALVFVASPNDLAWHLRTAGVRVYDQLLPATVLWAGVVLQRASPGVSAPPEHASG